LVKPGATPDEDQVVDAVRYEAAAPWPPAANGGGAALQLVDPSQDDSRVSNWSDGSGWRYYSATASPGLGGTSFAITLDLAGDFYIDEITLVTGAVANVGANILQNGVIHVLVEASVNGGATAGQTVQILLGDAATGSPTFDNQAANSSANEVRTVSASSVNGLREIFGTMAPSAG